MTTTEQLPVSQRDQLREDIKPIAWMYELARARTWKDGVPCGWTDWGEPQMSFYEPCVPEGAIRNLTPLFARFEREIVGREEEAAPTTSVSNCITDIPPGMKPWAGGDKAPDDWQRGAPVLQRNGRTTILDEGESGRLYSGWQSQSEYGIIAYTPRTTAPAAELVELPLKFEPKLAKTWWVAKMNSKFMSAYLGGDGYVKIRWRDETESGGYSIPWITMSQELAALSGEDRES